MPWIHVRIAHGPGRQSITDRYEHLDRATKQELEYLRESVKEEFPNDWEYGPSVITMKKIRALPADEHRDLVRTHTGRVHGSQIMLKILERTKTVTPRKPKKR